MQTLVKKNIKIWEMDELPVSPCVWWYHISLMSLPYSEAVLPSSSGTSTAFCKLALMTKYALYKFQLRNPLLPSLSPLLLFISFLLCAITPSGMPPTPPLAAESFTRWLCHAAAYWAKTRISDRTVVCVISASLALYPFPFVWLPLRLQYRTWLRIKKGCS